MLPDIHYIQTRANCVLSTVRLEVLWAVASKMTPNALQLLIFTLLCHHLLHCTRVGLWDQLNVAELMVCHLQD